MLRNWKPRAPEGDARHPDDGGRCRDLDDGTCGRGRAAAAPLPDGTLKIVARGVKEDPAGSRPSSSGTTRISAASQSPSADTASGGAILTNPLKWCGIRRFWINKTCIVG